MNRKVNLKLFDLILGGLVEWGPSDNKKKKIWLVNEIENMLNTPPGDDYVVLDTLAVQDIASMVADTDVIDPKNIYNLLRGTIR